MDTSHFFKLNPDQVLNAIESCGYLTTGEFYQLNSYENRVFDVVLEAADQRLLNNHIIAKFYRPGRWSRGAIQEEHDFLFELQKNEVPVVPPILINDQDTLGEFSQMYFSFFPKVLGRMPQEFIGDELKTVGRLLARLHNVGSQAKFNHRPTMGTPQHIGWQALDTLASWVTPELWARYEDAGQSIIDYLDDHLRPKKFIRIHGDHHKGNLLSNGKNFFFVDFDDSINGPAIQDFWMLLSGDQEESKKELDLLLNGYEDLRHFDDEELLLIPALRGLRILGYGAWIAQRWNDPSFPKIFPDFNTYNYWAEETEALERLAWQLD